MRDQISIYLCAILLVRLLIAAKSVLASAGLDVAGDGCDVFATDLEKVVGSEKTAGDVVGVDEVHIRGV